MSSLASPRRTSGSLTVEFVHRALKVLEDRLAAGEPSGLQVFDWNRDFVHGFAARDVAVELRLDFGFSDSLTWPSVHPFLKELAVTGRAVEVRVWPKGRGGKVVPLYRTVGG